jgi:serpin B
MLKRRAWLHLLLVLPLAGCAAAGGTLLRADRPRNESPRAARAALDALCSGNAQFAFDLYQHLRSREGNLFFSPYSLSVALAMTYAGARGETERQMADTLHFSLPQASLHPAFNALGLELASRGEEREPSDGQPFTLHIVNALWGQTGYHFLPEFLDLLAVNYDAGLRLLDFSRQPEASRARINEWITAETEGKIKDLLPEKSITREVALVLTDAIYFKAGWQEGFRFRERDTREGVFKLLDGSEVRVAMMHQTRPFRYAQGEGYQVVELPYQGEQLSMVVLLPDEGRFGEFERSLDRERVAAVLASLEEQPDHPTLVNLAMPKFAYGSAFRLKETLSAMGMPSAFGPADFSGIDGTTFLFISDVYHKAFVSVDEYGTEAAAATAVVLRMGIGEADVTIDRPFIFLIRDRQTGAILFLGRLLDPLA